jgi:inorganic pyrophosphatase
MAGRGNSNETIQVIIDTPKGSRSKYHFEPRLKKFRLSKLLPLGAVFPFDFGFVPKTKGGDGDPVDVLVLCEESSFPGCYVECRLIGVIEAEQKSSEGTERNDRLIAVAVASHEYAQIQTLSDLGKKQITEIEHFFISYNRFQNREFIPLNHGDPAKAKQIIKRSKTSR